ncbi:MAG: hypothetical protein R3E98_16900 [Gemmatimonadota bacterium]
MNALRSAAGLLPAALILSVGSAAGQTVGGSVGLQYATGRYVFDQRIHAVYLTGAARLTWARFEVSGSLPLVLQNGGLVTLVAGVPIPTGGEQAGVVARRERGETIGTRRGRGGGQGAGGGAMPLTMAAQDVVDSVAFEDGIQGRLGDPVLGAGVEVLRGDGALRSVRLSASAKAPLTDVESGVGTGEWDFAAGASLVLGVGRLLTFVDAQYWWLGDLPELELVDGVSYGVGASLSAFDGAGSVLLSLSGMSRTVESLEVPLSVALALGHRAGERAWLSAGVGAGLTESAPDLMAQVGLSLSR